ncbi:MAG: T9SS type A sorting domain-containing protein, partial [Cyclobacteriaceae bacterium]|nr:T9SS type A sorting domain-containing protein [Cyclobacteriaceae bacterium HetDA_MAG_MS6]
RPLECKPLLKQYGTDFFIAIEGHNEPDIFSKDQCYENACNDTRNGIYHASIRQHNALYDDLKSDPETVDLPVLAPSFARTNEIKNASGLKHDLRNLHYYPIWGEDSYPTVGYGWEGTTCEEVLVNVGDYNSDKGIFLTESGHGIHQYSPRAQAKYIGRMFAEYFDQMESIEKFFYFRLMQQFNTGSGHEEWGLIDTLGNRLPAFHALKSIIDLLSEASYDKVYSKWIVSNPSFIPHPITISFSGKLNTTHYLLLQKGTGMYYLLLWQEINSYLAVSKEGLDPSEDELGFTVAEGIKRATRYRYNSNWEFEPESIPIVDGNTILLQIPDYITVFEFESDVSPVVLGERSSLRQAVRLYPNPIKGIVHLEIGNSTIIKAIELAHITGQKIKELDSQSSVIDLTVYPSGVYYLRITTDRKVFNKPVVIIPYN